MDAGLAKDLRALGRRGGRGGQPLGPEHRVLQGPLPLVLGVPQLQQPRLLSRDSEGNGWQDGGGAGLIKCRKGLKHTHVCRCT